MAWGQPLFCLLETSIFVSGSGDLPPLSCGSALLVPDLVLKKEMSGQGGLDADIMNKKGKENTI